MSKQSRFVCQECGAVLSKWMGQCDICKAWNSVVEEVNDGLASTKKDVPDDFFVTLEPKDDSAECLASSRHNSGIAELDRVLGGGFVDGSVILIGGSPGIGKSTLLMQILANSVGLDKRVYISAEESVGQVSMRAKRLGITNESIQIASTSDIHQIISAINKFKGNGIVVVDSVQTVGSELIQSPPGSISQVRFCTQELVNFAKRNNVIVIIVSHITKDGAIAGPKTLEHMVDTVLYFEGDRSYDYRILRVEKNRYGSTDEIGVFSMTESGLKEVLNPSSAFLSDRENSVSGVAVFSGIEGTRPILSEVQALVSNTSVAMPRRSAVGFDSNRLAMLVAVLSNRCKMNFSNKDVYVNIAGGLKVSEPSVDLAIAAAIISSAYRTALPAGSVFFGEVSLSGEVRQSHLAFSRIKEAQKLGFTKIFCSYKTEDYEKTKTLQMHKIKSIRDLQTFCLSIKQAEV
ncbi:MAG: DNA repair protein RadA [Alphaproteobacteria bacterium]|nr:DNA repair protein RadA [Alphaproteobacteria bacterium]